ncbi:CCA tRNA nucleotidyltransferase [Cellulosilyticum sp. I15G10I2]|uniref:CCA tRNA nucleotidyltransferase n=1 Tax=Cellulosilyticum sp. I15G10I2 TaxID=1892843 RepID=UPI00085C83A4|nr:CCA tRNA nucleotidyltransferase [Cellulosilyticum sp. I15G10I2]
MSINYNQKIPKDVLEIIVAIEKAGYEAYIVGGCVRDMLMHREPHDFDITTSAKPEAIKNIFKRTYDTGIKHGTVTVILSHEHYEVTTYRIEGEYKDFRRPEEVSFVEDITLDLSRRDFTMNAIAYHPVRGFIDPYKGIEDIKRKCIRSVRDASERFTEDALRILRAIRFSAQLQFEIEESTLKGISECKDLLMHISKERIRDEFIKIGISPSPSHIHKLYELKLLQYIVPEFIGAYQTPQNHPHHIYNVAEHTIVAMEHTPPDVFLRLTLFLHDIGKINTRTTDKKGIDHFYNHAEESVKILKKVLKDLRLDNHTIRDMSLLVEYHDYHLRNKISKISIKKLLSIMGPDLFDQLMIVQFADVKAQNPQKLAPKLEMIEQQKAIKEEILKNGECYNKAMLTITGQDLIEGGIPRGEVIGRLLEKALDYVIRKPEANKKSGLIAYCLEQYEKKKK